MEEQENYSAIMGKAEDAITPALLIVREAKNRNIPLESIAPNGRVQKGLNQAESFLTQITETEDSKATKQLKSEIDEVKNYLIEKNIPQYP